MKTRVLAVALALSCAAVSWEVRSGELPAYDAELSGFDYPFPVHSFEFTSQKQELRMAYMDVSPQNGNGTVVMLLHGKNFGGYYWEPTVRALSDAGFRVIVPDQIGFGKSSKPECYQFSFQGLALNTHALLERLQVKQAIVVGHSMGGMLAARFALMYPESTAKLVLVNPIGLEDWKRSVPYMGIDEQYKQELKTNSESIREYQKKAYYAGHWKPEYEALIQAQAGMTRHPDFPKVAWDSALTYEMLYTQPVVYEFPLIQAPALLIIGQRDRTAPGRERAPKEAAEKLGDYPRLGKAAAQAIPHARLVEIEGAGHLPQVEKFDEYKKALLDFIRE
jgi:pimeloyl-ACP methyl ester carboxylesterase